MGLIGQSFLNNDVEIWITYQDTGAHRIQNVEWSITGINSVRARIWDNDILVYDETKPPGSGEQNVPGNYRAVFNEESPDPLDHHWELPPNLTVQFDYV